jgi:putative SOS response-associated peptidase YedK
MYIRLKSGEPFAFAGLWEAWHGAGDHAILSCTVVTMAPNELVKEIHNRMPVILDPAAYDLWLDPGERSADELDEWLRPYPAEQMLAYPVSTFVNSPANDTPDCIAPAA